MTERANTGLPDGFTEVATGFALAKIGDKITGVFQGKGSGKHVPKKGKVPAHTIPTYKLVDTDTGAVTEILGSSQIETFLNARKVGEVVYMERTGQVEGGKGRVNTYRFAYKAGKPGRS